MPQPATEPGSENAKLSAHALLVTRHERSFHKYYANIRRVGLKRVVAESLIRQCNYEATGAGRQRDNAPANSADASG
jgi:hypothetical protein